MGENKELLMFISYVMKEIEKSISDEKDENFIYKKIALTIIENYYNIFMDESFEPFYCDNSIEVISEVFIQYIPEDKERYEIILTILERIVKKLSNFCITNVGLKNFFKLGVEPKDLYRLLNNTAKDDWIRKVREKYENFLEIARIIRLDEYCLFQLKQYYQILKECYFDKGRNPELNDYKKIRMALKELKASKEFIDYVLPKRIKEKVKEERQTSIKLTKDFKLGLTNEEYKELNEQANSYYNFDGNMPKHNLDLLEKINFIMILQRLEYTEDEIIRILWNIDMQWPQKKLSNQPDDKIRSMRLVLLLMKKEQTSNLATVYIDFFNEINKSKEQDKLFWISYLRDCIKEDNHEINKIFLENQRDVSSISIYQKEGFCKSYKTNIKEKYGSTSELLKRILKEHNGKSKEEKEAWSECFYAALDRFAIEQFGTYEFEMGIARKLEQKES